jgi:hypothetical protein
VLFDGIGGDWVRGRWLNTGKPVNSSKLAFFYGHNCAPVFSDAQQLSSCALLYVVNSTTLLACFLCARVVLSSAFLVARSSTAPLSLLLGDWFGDIEHSSGSTFVRFGCMLYAHFVCLPLFTIVVTFYWACAIVAAVHNSFHLTLGSVVIGVEFRRSNCVVLSLHH